MFCKIDTLFAQREGGGLPVFFDPSHSEMKNYEKMC